MIVTGSTGFPRGRTIGALGSRANNAKRRARLAQLELSPTAIGKLHGPVGLPIGSRTPAEIAIAILAELTAVRNGITLHRLNEPERAEMPPDADVTTCAVLRASC